MSRAFYRPALGVGLTLAVGAILLPVRSHLSIATIGLILVLPVVASVVVGGVPGGVASVVTGFLTYDFAFIPPYYTLTVGAGQDWVALGVYVAVMLLVAQVVSRLQDARFEAQRRASEAQRFLELSELLVADRPQSDLLQRLAEALRSLFRVSGVALLLPEDDRLQVVASAGEPPGPAELHDLQVSSGLPISLSPPASGGPDSIQAVALTASGRPVGLLALRGQPQDRGDRDLLRVFVNQAALAIERAQLREQLMRTQLLEETDRVRRALLGAVSHDLRTPLASMKVASSALLDGEGDLGPDERRELFRLVDGQIDRLSRLVTGLLDMNRYQAGTLQLHTAPQSVADLIEEAVTDVQPSVGDREISVEIQDGLPAVRVDRVLVGEVLVNLLDNAERHAPPGTAVEVQAERRGPVVRISVSDRGPGVKPAEHEAVFERFFRSGAGGRAGLGLWICRTFVEAHGQQIWVEDVEGGGARFVFTMEAT